MDIATNFASARALYEMTQSDLEGLGDDYSNEEGDLFSDANLAALDALFLTAAADFSGLLYKLEAFAAEDGFGFSPHIRDPLWAALIADVRRLGGK